MGPEKLVGLACSLLAQVADTSVYDQANSLSPQPLRQGWPLHQLVPPLLRTTDLWVLPPMGQSMVGMLEGQCLERLCLRPLVPWEPGWEG